MHKTTQRRFVSSEGTPNLSVPSHTHGFVEITNTTGMMFVFLLRLCEAERLTEALS